MQVPDWLLFAPDDDPSQSLANALLDIDYHEWIRELDYEHNRAAGSSVFMDLVEIDPESSLLGTVV